MASVTFVIGFTLGFNHAWGKASKSDVDARIGVDSMKQAVAATKPKEPAVFLPQMTDEEAIQMEEDTAPGSVNKIKNLVAKSRKAQERELDNE